MTKRESLDNAWDRFSLGCSNSFGGSPLRCRECRRVFLRICREIDHYGREVPPLDPRVKQILQEATRP